MRPFRRACLVIIAALACLLTTGGQAQPESATLALLGDVMLGRGVAQAYLDGDLSPALAAVAPVLHSADLAAANLESPLTSDPITQPEPTSDSYYLCANPLGLPSLEHSGLDLLGLANNHRNDCASGGTVETARLVTENGLLPFGMEGVSSSFICGRRWCSFIALDDVSAPLDLTEVTQRIYSARAQADWVIVSIHWGLEYSASPTPRQRQIAQQLADAGADVVWGHHPHVLQPVEELHGKGRERSTLVAYSLGNAIFDQPMPFARRTALLVVRLVPSGAVVEQWIPLEISLPDWRLTPYVDPE